MPGLFSQGSRDWVFFCFRIWGGRHVILNYFLKKKSQTMPLLYCTVLDHCGSRKNWANGFVDQKTEFSTHCLTKTLRKYHKKLDKLIYSLKKPKKTVPKLEINPKQKILPRSNMFFLAISR